MQIVVREAVLYSDNVAIADEKGNRVTYRELAQKAETLSSRIEGRSLVFVLCDHQIETAAFLYEMLYLNHVILPLPWDISMEYLNNLTMRYKPQFIYCTKGHRSCEKYSPEMVYENHLLLKTGERQYSMHADTALLLSTSGTTGSTKMARISFSNLYDNAEFACRHLDIRCGQKGISPLPINYTYGFAFCLWHWHCGATLLVTEEPVMSNVYSQFFRREKAENFAATPYTFQMLQRVRFWDAEKLGYLHWAMSGGARMPEEQQAAMIGIMGEKFRIGYGQTECTCIIASMNCQRDQMKLGSIGKPFDNMEISVQDDTKELLIKSRSVCMGYAESVAELAEGDMNHGFLHTGDAVNIDEDGYIYLIGRLARFVKILGKRVSLDDMERYLAEKFTDTEFACTGNDDKIAVFYVGRKGSLDGEVIRLLNQDLMIPGKFVSCIGVTEIPRNAAGKIMYSKLGEWLDGR